MNYKLYHAGPLVAVRYIQGERARRSNGLLVNPPKLYVTSFNEELDQMEFEPITWKAAIALATEHVAELRHQMSTDRRLGDAHATGV